MKISPNDPAPKVCVVGGLHGLCGALSHRLRGRSKEVTRSQQSGYEAAVMWLRGRCDVVTRPQINFTELI